MNRISNYDPYLLSLLNRDPRYLRQRRGGERVLARTKGHNAGWIVITAGWALGVFVGAFCAAPFSSAHLNPAVTVAMAAAESWPAGKLRATSCTDAGRDCRRQPGVPLLPRAFQGL